MFQASCMIGGWRSLASAGLVLAGMTSCGGNSEPPGRVLSEPLFHARDNQGVNAPHAIWTEQSNNWVLAVTNGDGSRHVRLRLTGPGGLVVDKPVSLHGRAVVILPHARGTYRGTRIGRGSRQSIILWSSKHARDSLDFTLSLGVRRRCLARFVRTADGTSVDRSSRSIDRRALCVPRSGLPERTVERSALRGHTPGHPSQAATVVRRLARRLTERR
jgi:hypothetical protein